RTLTVNAANLTVANPDGYDGNPLFSIAATISSDHSFTGEVNVTQNVAFTGGITGDVTGNVTGNLTGDVTGNVTGNLTGNADGNHTGSFTGDVDVSGGSITFAAKQIPLAALGQDVLDFIAL